MLKRTLVASADQAVGMWDWPRRRVVLGETDLANERPATAPGWRFLRRSMLAQTRPAEERDVMPCLDRLIRQIVLEQHRRLLYQPPSGARDQHRLQQAGHGRLTERLERDDHLVDPEFRVRGQAGGDHICRPGQRGAGALAGVDVRTLE